MFDYASPLGENEKALPFSSGPVAQLGARFHGMEEVVGSIPTRSTKYSAKFPLAASFRTPQLVTTLYKSVTSC